MCACESVSYVTVCAHTRMHVHVRHKDARMKYHVEKSVIVKHAWTNDHPINWTETKILQRTNRAMDLVLKESLSIHMTPDDTALIETAGMELPDYWIATCKKSKGEASLSSTHSARTNARDARSGMHTNQN